MANDPIHIPGRRGGSDGGGSSISGAVFATDITVVNPDDNVEVIFEAGSFDRKVESFLTDTNDIIVEVYVEGGTGLYTPIVTVDGVTVTNLVEDPNDFRTFTGSANITLDGDETEIIVSSSTGATHTIPLTFAPTPPAILTATFDLLSGNLGAGQTELKENDAIDIILTFEPGATQINVLDFGGVKAQTVAITETDTSATITVLADDEGDILQQLPARIQLQTALGTLGTLFDTTNTAPFNNLFPSFTFNSITYPVSQQALKGSESADVDVEVNNADTATYTSPTSELNIPNVNTIEQVKTVDRIAGAYNVSNTNYRIVANRAANNATATFNDVVNIANEPPSFSIVIAGNPPRLRRGVAPGEVYSITITADQLVTNPLFDTIAKDANTVLSSLSGADPGQTFTATYTLTIQNPDPLQGVQVWTMEATNLAGVSGNTIASGEQFEIGGFTQIQVIFTPAFTQLALIGMPVTGTDNANKLVCITQIDEVLTYVTNTSNIVDAFTITDASGVFTPNGDYLFYNDKSITDINGTGTLSLFIEELA